MRVHGAPQIEGVVFDLDGVLIDSEPLWRDAEIEVFASVGIVLDHELCQRTMGLRSDEVVAHWRAQRPWSGASTAEVEAELLRVVATHIRHRGEPKPGIDEVLGFLEGRGIPVAVASSSPNAVIAAALERLDLGARFACVCSAEDEPFGKPHPGVYLTAAARLGISPACCCAIEDSPNGVLAAKAAGMTCIAIPDQAYGADPRIMTADRVVGALTDLDATIWDALGLRGPAR